MPENSSSLELSGISVTIIRKANKHSYLRVKKDGGVVMTANHRLSIKQIQQIVEKYLPQLKEKIALQKLRQTTKTNQITNIKFLGGTILLDDLLNSYDNKPKPINSLLISDQIKIINSWYMIQAKKIFTERFELGLQLIQSWNIIKPRLSVKTMTTRWGSYSKSTHKVSLNLRLIKVPLDLIDYVIAHELTHIIHYNHSKEFYALLSTICPKWKEQRNNIKRIAFEIINSPT